MSGRQNQVIKTINDVIEETNEEENDLNQLREYVSELEDNIEKEHDENKRLNKIIIKQNKVIKTFQNDTDSEKYKANTKSKKKCRYWNRGFCKRGEQCHFDHPKDDCQRFSKSGICEDKTCKDRHRRVCRYFTTEKGCFRNEDCQYIHDQVSYVRHKTQEKEYRNKVMNINYECNYCDFDCVGIVTLNKHVHKKHENSTRKESENI